MRRASGQPQQLLVEPLGLGMGVGKQAPQLQVSDAGAHETQIGTMDRDLVGEHSGPKGSRTQAAEEASPLEPGLCFLTQLPQFCWHQFPS